MINDFNLDCCFLHPIHRGMAGEPHPTHSAQWKHHFPECPSSRVRVGLYSGSVRNGCGPHWCTAGHARARPRVFPCEIRRWDLLPHFSLRRVTVSALRASAVGITSTVSTAPLFPLLPLPILPIARWHTAALPVAASRCFRKFGSWC